MGKQTGISWTDHTWNPWRGCKKVSAGCKHCYMFSGQERWGLDPAVVVRASAKTFNDPLRWNQAKRVFTCSWSDFFIQEADEWRDEAWEIIKATPHLTYQILTKRPERILQCLPAGWGEGWPNVWLGVSVENQEYWDERVPLLVRIPAKVRFVSAEPLLGPVDLEGYALSLENEMGEGAIDWIITGGESGAGFRSADLTWFRYIRDQCNYFGIPFFHKQNGGTRKINGEWGGNELDGKVWQEFPK